MQSKGYGIHIAMPVAILFMVLLIASCQKNEQTAPQNNEDNEKTITATTNPPVSSTQTAAGTISYNNKSNITITGLSINCNNKSLVGIQLQNCNNVHITNCKVYNSLLQGIKLYNCTNVTIDYCFVTNVQAGVYVQQSKTIKVNNNQFLNMNGPFPSGNFVQFDNVSGGGNQINTNKCEDIAGVAKHPQDGLSVYKSNGLQGDSIQVIGNWIRGGQVLNDSGGAAGIVLADVGGSYQVARNNILVNPGYIGIQPQGGTHIKIDHNTIYSSSTPMGLVGLSGGNYSGTTSSDVTVSYNKVKFINAKGNEFDAWWNTASMPLPQGWNTNILEADITSSVLPVKIITMQ